MKTVQLTGEGTLANDGYEPVNSERQDIPFIHSAFI